MYYLIQHPRDEESVLMFLNDIKQCLQLKTTSRFHLWRVNGCTNGKQKGTGIYWPFICYRVFGMDSLKVLNLI